MLELVGGPSIHRQVSAKWILNRACFAWHRCECGNEMDVRIGPHPFDMGNVTRGHCQDKVGLIKDFRRQRSRPVSGNIEIAFKTDEKCFVTRWRSGRRLNAGTLHLDVGSTRIRHHSLDNCLSEWTSTGVAGAYE